MFTMHYLTDCSGSKEFQCFVEDIRSESSQAWVREVLLGRYGKYTASGIQWYEVPEYSYFELLVGGESVHIVPVKNEGLFIQENTHYNDYKFSTDKLAISFEHLFKNMWEPELERVYGLGRINQKDFCYYTQEGKLVEVRFYNTAEMPSETYEQLKRGATCESLLQSLECDTTVNWSVTLASLVDNVLLPVVYTVYHSDRPSELRVGHFKNLRQLINTVGSYKQGVIECFTLDYKGFYFRSVIVDGEITEEYDSEVTPDILRFILENEPSTKDNTMLKGNADQLIRDVVEQLHAEVVKGALKSPIFLGFKHRYEISLRDYATLTIYNIENICEENGHYHYDILREGSLAYDESAMNHFKNSYLTTRDEIIELLRRG